MYLLLNLEVKGGAWWGVVVGGGGITEACYNLEVYKKREVRLFFPFLPLTFTIYSCAMLGSMLAAIPGILQLQKSVTI